MASELYSSSHFSYPALFLAAWLMGHQPVLFSMSPLWGGYFSFPFLEITGGGSKINQDHPVRKGFWFTYFGLAACLASWLDDFTLSTSEWRRKFQKRLSLDERGRGTASVQIRLLLFNVMSSPKFIADIVVGDCAWAVWWCPSHGVVYWVRGIGNQEQEAWMGAGKREGGGRERERPHGGRPLASGRKGKAEIIVVSSIQRHIHSDPKMWLWRALQNTHTCIPWGEQMFAFLPQNGYYQ